MVALTEWIYVKACDCRSGNISGIPCCHAMFAIYEKDGILEDYVSDSYKQDQQLAAYSFMMDAISGEKFWSECNDPHPLPPPHHRFVGRPAKNRRKEHWEVGGSGRLSKVGTKQTCSLCFVSGHNKRNCPKKIDFAGSKTSRLPKKVRNACK